MRSYVRGRPWRAILTLTLVLLIVAGAAVPRARAATVRTTSGVLTIADEGINEISSMDPDAGGGPDANDALVQNMIFGGLGKLDLHGKEVPNAATWTVSRDGLAYTYHLKPGLRFSDGHAVTAADVAWSIRRAINSKMATSGILMNDLLGATAYNNGTAKSVAGITVISASTLQLRLVQPGGYFPYTVSSAILEPSAILKYGPLTNTRWAEHPVGIGPFSLKQWVHNQYVSLVPNPYYPGPKPRLKEVRILFIPNAHTAFELYQTGGVGIMGALHFPASDLATVKGHPDLHTVPLMETDFLDPNTKKAPFDNVHVRRAFAMAIDRAVLSNNIMQGTVSPSATILPQTMPGYNPALQHILAYNPQQARKELALAGYPGGKGFPQTTYIFSNTGPDESLRAAALQQMWQEVLNVHVNLNNMELSAYNNVLTAKTYQLGLIQSSDDYPDPQDFLQGLKSNNPCFNGCWSNATYDRLYAQGNQLPLSDARRYTIYNQAERIALESAAWMPMDNMVGNVLIKPSVHGVYLNGAGLVFPDWSTISVSG